MSLFDAFLRGLKPLITTLAMVWAVKSTAFAEPSSTTFQPGDLLFKPATTAIWTEIAARYSEGDTRWGHVGMIVSVEEDQVIVVHADMGRPDIRGTVKAEPLSHFGTDVDQIGHFRPQLSSAQRVEMAAFGALQAQQATPFDRAYELESLDALYCTELIWRAWEAALGRDPLPVKSRRMRKTYVALSDLSLHPDMLELGTITLTPIQKGPAALAGP